MQAKYINPYTDFVLLFLIVFCATPAISGAFMDVLEVVAEGAEKHSAKTEANNLKHKSEELIPEAFKLINDISLYDQDSLELRKSFELFKIKVRESDDLIKKAQESCIQEIGFLYSMKGKPDSPDQTKEEDKCKKTFSIPSEFSRINEDVVKLDYYLKKGVCFRRFGFFKMKREDYNCTFLEVKRDIITPLLNNTGRLYKRR